LPITQERFDEIFELIGIPEFKTSYNASWDNYTQFINIIKQVRDFLKTKDQNTTLLDAHSFLYILGSQMKEEKFQFTSTVDSTLEQTSTNGIDNSQNYNQQLLDRDNQIEEPVFNDEKLPEELPDEISEQLFEGAKKTVTINAYERSTEAREQCIEYWKAICAVCDFDFEESYGELGKGFIHVHHLKPISQIGDTYQVDPINDLRPVCPNCHAMLHRQKETLTIEELKTIMAAVRVTELASR
jgi:predicted HNH restriction endonuclease